MRFELREGQTKDYAKDYWATRKSGEHLWSQILTQTQMKWGFLRNEGWEDSERENPESWISASWLEQSEKEIL